MASIKSFSDIPVAGKVGIAVLVFVLVSLAYYYLFYSGLAEQITSETDAGAAFKAKIAAAQRREKEYISLTKELAEREPIDQRNKKILPEKSETGAFLKDLNQVAEISGLTMRLVEPRAEQQEEFYTKIPVSLGMTGGFHQLGKFFYNVSKIDRIINMEDISLTKPRPTRSGELILTANVMATTYKRPADGESNPKPAKKLKAGH